MVISRKYTIHGANQCLNNAWFIYSKLFFSISCFRFLGEFLFNILRYTSLRPGGWFWWICLCFLLGIVYFCLGSLFLSPDWRLVIIFRFGYVCFCAGLAGYVFESCFLFLFLSATIFMYYEENMSLNFRNTTCSANHIDTWKHTLSVFFFVLAKKQYLWNALSLLPDDLVKCSFHGFLMLEFVCERNITDSGRKHLT